MHCNFELSIYERKWLKSAVCYHWLAPLCRSHRIRSAKPRLFWQRTHVALLCLLYGYILQRLCNQSSTKSLWVSSLCKVHDKSSKTPLPSDFKILFGFELVNHYLLLWSQSDSFSSCAAFTVLGTKSSSEYPWVDRQRNLSLEPFPILDFLFSCRWASAAGLMTLDSFVVSLVT